MTDHLISFSDAQSDLLACSAYLAEGIQSRDGRGQAMISIVPRYLAKGDVDLAAELANTVDDPFVRDRLLIAVAEKCASADDEEYALQLVEAIEDFGLQLQGRERIGLQLAAVGKFEKARDVADSMEHRDTVLAGIAVKQHEEGNENVALETVGEIGFPVSAVQALMSMASAEIEAANFEHSAKLLEKALASADEIEHDEEKIRAFIDIGNAFIAAKRNDRSVETFDKARVFADVLDNIHRDSFLGGVSLGFLRAGSLELADRALDSVADKTQIANCLLGFARVFWQREEKGEALEALEEAFAILRSQPDAETRDSKAKLALFAAIAVQFAGFEKGERGMEIAQEIANENESMNGLRQIARILAIQKNDDLARHAINSIPDDGQRVFALIAVSDVASTNEDAAKAASLLEEANALAEEVPQLASRSAAYNSIANRFVALGDMDRAQAIASANLALIATIKDESSQASSLADLAESFENAGFAPTDADTEIIKSILVPNRL